MSIIAHCATYNPKMATKMQDEKNEVYMLEQQQTNRSDFEKPAPIVGKQDYSGAHEVRLLRPLRPLLSLLSPSPLRPPPPMSKC